jgi:hypothetical protein
MYVSMMSTMSKDALARAIAHGEYVVDAHAVAEAMLRRSGGAPSLVLVAPQPLDPVTVRIEQDEPGSGADVA